MSELNFHVVSSFFHLKFLCVVFSWFFGRFSSVLHRVLFLCVFHVIFSNFSSILHLHVHFKLKLHVIDSFCEFSSSTHRVFLKCCFSWLIRYVYFVGVSQRVSG